MFSAGSRLCWVRHHWVAWAGAGAVVVAAAFTWSVWEAPARIPLTPKDDLRILKVSLGTNHVFSLEPIWKQVLRSVLPAGLMNRWGADPAARVTTRESTLFVWVDEVDAAGARHSSSFDQPAARLEGGQVAAAEFRELPSRVVRLKFQSFARDLEEVPLQIRRGTNLIQFTVRNPRRSVRASWRAEPGPQTNLKRTWSRARKWCSAREPGWRGILLHPTRRRCERNRLRRRGGSPGG
jgi:hypothetical protein